jgi:hypothetical protein
VTAAISRVRDALKTAELGPQPDKIEPLRTVVGTVVGPTAKLENLKPFQPGKSGHPGRPFEEAAEHLRHL